MPAETWTVTRRDIPWYPAAGRTGRDLPLGRHVRHDSRSLAYPYRRASGAPLVSVLHARHAPIWDQGHTGSCTGQAEAGALAADPLFATLAPAGKRPPDEPMALALYSAAERIDGGAGLPSEDDGSSGLSACEAARSAGLISGYVHCLSLEDVLNALQSGPVIVGCNWYDSMDEPASSGLVSISPGAQVRGGHETVWRGCDVPGRTVFGDNSWGTSFGLHGSMSMAWATLERLLAEQGDATVSVPLSQPAPVPVPVPPAPAPPPYPASPADVAHASPDMIAWAAGRHAGANGRAAKSFTAWRTARGL